MLSKNLSIYDLGMSLCQEIKQKWLERCDVIDVINATDIMRHRP